MLWIDVPWLILVWYVVNGATSVAFFVVEKSEVSACVLWLALFCLWLVVCVFVLNLCGGDDEWWLWW